MIKNFFLATLIFASFGAYAQPYKTIKPFKPYKWMISVQWSAVDDDGNSFGNLFNAPSSWNIRPYPTRITLDRYFVYGRSAELAVTYAQYTPNKIVNGSTGISGINLSIDLSGKYSFYTLYAPKARWIEPYVNAGIGFTFRTGTADAYVPTVNLGGGLNFWLHSRVGIQLSSNAKFAVYPKFWNTNNNYLQHNIGLVYRTPDSSSHRSSNKKRHKWTNKQPKKYKQKGGH